MRPTTAGDLGDTHFDGDTTWLWTRRGWVDRLPLEQPPIWNPDVPRRARRGRHRLGQV